MAQMVQVLPTKPEDMSSSPSTYMKKRTDPLKVFSNLHTHLHSVCTRTRAHTIKRLFYREWVSENTRGVLGLLPATYVKKKFIQ